MPEKIEEYTSVESLLREIVGFAKESLIDESFTKNKTKVIIRRIMQYSNVRQEYSIPVWDILDIEPDMNNVTASISKMREETQKSSEKYRWIPNTGEYLMLGGIHMTVRNKAGIILQGNKYRVSFLGAIDRNFVNTENGSSDNGNINTNKAERFLIKFFSGKNEIEQGKIYKEKINNQYSGNYRYVMDYSSNNMIPSYFTIGKGGLLYANKNPLMIAIRPESSEKAYPGDDLLLNFSTVATLESNVVSKGIIVNEQDYVAVYDKKMLWRANLYIDLKEPELNDLDWNNAHPWNAPPASDKITGTWADSTNSNTYIVNWNDTDWGNNEWNRSLKTFDVKEDVFTGLKDLPSGDGGQVVDLKSFTPIRTIGGSMAKPENNKIYGTVAYSYPKHSSEPPENNKGNSGSMDSPFDYVKKLMYQEKQLNKWFATSSSKVRNSEETTVDSSHWLKLVEAPLESWYMYEITSTTDLSNKMFLPSYGLRLLGSDYAQNVIVNGDSRTYSTVVSDYLGTDKKGKDNLIEAGTDCLGFASRAASYSGNKYKWYDVPKGWTEYSSGSGTNNISDVFDSYGQWNNANGDLTVNKGTRTYPWSNVDGKGDGDTHSYNIFTTREYKDSSKAVKYDASMFVDVTKSSVKEGLAKDKAPYLLKIVPGDIFVKCSDLDTHPSYEMDSHIAIVAYVPGNAEEMSVEELLNSIVLIEAEFGWRVQSVIKTFTLGDYQNSNIKNKILELYKDMYDNADCIEDLNDNSKVTDRASFNLNNRHYAIRRLIWN